MRNGTTSHNAEGMATNPADIGGLNTPLPLNSSRIHISREAIIWLAVGSTIVAIATGIGLWLLCRCSFCSRRRRRGQRRRSSFINDGRDEHYYWNKKLPVPMGENAWKTKSRVPLRPLSKAAVKPGGEGKVGLPVVVEFEEDQGEVKPKRYYGDGRGTTWRDSVAKRFSSRSSGIGRAY